MNLKNDVDNMLAVCARLDWLAMRCEGRDQIKIMESARLVSEAGKKSLGNIRAALATLDTDTTPDEEYTGVQVAVAQ